MKLILSVPLVLLLSSVAWGQFTLDNIDSQLRAQGEAMRQQREEASLNDYVAIVSAGIYRRLGYPAVYEGYKVGAFGGSMFRAGPYGCVVEHNPKGNYSVEILTGKRHKMPGTYWAHCRSADNDNQNFGF